MKIGRSQDPERRLRQLETGRGGKFDQSTICHVYVPFACERHLHRRYWFLRDEGKWFCLGERLFENVVEYMEGKQ